MARFKSKLHNVHVAAPCNVDWDTMYGNERVRFCAQCQLNVYNLSEMTKADAERLVGSAGGRLCVRYYRRRDGSILTQNCPVGLRALKRRLNRVASAAASTVLSFLAGMGVFGFLNYLSRTNFDRQEVLGDMLIVVPVTKNPSPEFTMSMGKMVSVPKRKR